MGRRTASLPRRRASERGFSLVELMVALLIGMVGVVVVMRLFASAEGDKRTTTGGNDAQAAGGLALYELQREIAQSGHGIGNFLILGCGLSYTTSRDTAAVTLDVLAPVVVNPRTALVPAGDSGTDTLLLVTGASAGPSEGDATIAASVAGRYDVSTAGMFGVGNRVVAATATRPSPCALTLDTVSAISGSTLTVSPGTAGLPSGSSVFDLGVAPRVQAYAVRQGSLTVCDYLAWDCGSSNYIGNPDVWVPLAGNIVGLRAQYGRDTSGVAGSAMSGVVDTWDQTTPGGAADTSGLPLECRWARVVALRLAVVARSPAYDKGTVTSAAPTWDGSTANTSLSAAWTTLTPVALPIDLSANADWMHYRHRVLQATVPLRNLIWQGSQLTYQGGSGGC
ncbi:PilW family protein [Rhizobacter sp. SG703]|uniref:PilW family protein n=1 Tax=Rhizobacter sp. SG703 TaxID=2587140 RepID=UPI001447F70D|nr:PilW family protein [Rhizobacter sp. SG703]NKI95014.1 type IV pilus assembly protein PilW [Rhizobacter sp. SG703]